MSPVFAALWNFTGTSLTITYSLGDKTLLQKMFETDWALRIFWKESKWYFINKIHYTFKLKAQGKLFHFDESGLKSGLDGFFW